MHNSRKRIVLVAAIVLSQLLAVYLLVSNLQARLAKQLDANAEISLNFLADGVTGRTQRFIKPVEDAVQTAADLVSAGLLDPTDDDRLIEYFTAQLNATDWLSGMFVGRVDGSFIFLKRNEIGLRSKAITLNGGKRTVSFIQRDDTNSIAESWVDEQDDYDPRTRPWFKAASAGSDIAWTSPYTFYSTGLPGMTVARRLASGNVIAADIDLAQLSDFVSVNPHTEEGVAIIASADNRVIAYSDTSLFASATGSDGLPKLDQIDSAPLKALLAHSEKVDPELSVSDDKKTIGSFDTDSAIEADGALVNLEVDNTPYLGLVRPFTLSSGRINWALLVQIPAKDYSAGALLLLDRSVWALGALSLALGALTLLGVAWLHQSARPSRSCDERESLTGALLQAPFEHRVFRTLLPGAFERHANSHAIMIIELRHLRHLIDRSGEAAGNAILLAAAQKIESILQESDLLGRTAENRFLVYLFEQHEETLLERVDQLHAGVSETLDAHAGNGGKVVSMASGAALFEKGEPPANLMQRAREATAIGIELGTVDCQIAGRFHGASGTDQQAAA